MNAHILTGGELTTGRRKPSELVAEYETKVAGVLAALAEFEAARDAVKMAASIGGTWGNRTLDTGRLGEGDMLAALLSSAWRHTYQLYGLENFASAAEKKRIEQMFADPPPFTVENIRERFGTYIMDPWGSILRGLAEQFAGLDPAFKSHEKVKVGVKGLPKRVILAGFSEYSSSYGAERVRDILNALAAYQGKPLLTHRELAALIRDGNALIEDGTVPADRYNEAFDVVGRGVWLKRFKNGRGHLFFGPDALRDVNRALAEFYGDVLPDAAEERPAAPRAGTAVAKDLQYYPTPARVVDLVLQDLRIAAGARVLEPSCGCGRFMDALRARGARVFGIEVDPGRAAQCRARGHSVLTANFLETEPTADFDHVVMNPPFSGKLYMRHVRHAFKYLKAGGLLISILPITARYDHGLVASEFNEPSWWDLPVGSFSESGTNINTTVLKVQRYDQ